MLHFRQVEFTITDFSFLSSCLEAKIHYKCEEVENSIFEPWTFAYHKILKEHNPRLEG